MPILRMHWPVDACWPGIKLFWINWSLLVFSAILLWYAFSACRKVGRVVAYIGSIGGGALLSLRTLLAHPSYTPHL
ncbi:unknown [Tropheryma whipplei str. Twist]|uniref:Uncharacterized protein n=1 Tax=Tropheryma whipplei (strain Twist) TaxID=203267 RepID=Q83GS5_TROWT|nr:unknown [Tropheryma whipplei str. Twist]